MKIKNNAGETVEFEISKLESSLRNSGAGEQSVKRVLETVLPKCFEGITTGELYRMAFEELKKISNSVAARYSLKKALLELGPAGFYFEQWISRVFQNIGYKTETGQLIKGHSVTHEADVIAKKDSKTYWVECKFRNAEDTKISVTTPMYVLSRIKDISNIQYNLFGTKTEFTDGWLITNTYFTKDSVAFSEYYGLRLLSWDYPKDKNIKSLVDQNALYPITCLTTLDGKQKQKLLEKRCVLVKELFNNQNLLNVLELNQEKKSEVLKETKELMNTKISE
ncbi:restriction endonuclease [Epilithonimonas hungarica]|jgi:Restriction endonuclease.|uniref:Restriction endonuclease n=1 Tax=Epilithonimonas hungarica TaxID=454006 RepID=A0A1G7GYC5_9FLAO|nr:restriction endonuclease [Epilithonimonas hungarica]SDE93168.1 Restriction endonuclease [Epilithonimonas hungarica]